MYHPSSPHNTPPRTLVPQVARTRPSRSASPLPPPLRHDPHGNPLSPNHGFPARPCRSEDEAGRRPPPGREHGPKVGTPRGSVLPPHTPRGSPRGRAPSDVRVAPVGTHHALPPITSPGRWLSTPCDPLLVETSLILRLPCCDPGFHEPPTSRVHCLLQSETQCLVPGRNPHP